MEMDDTLKNRVAGAIVITILAVIFLPMFFDEPAKETTPVVSELEIPKKPEVSPSLTTKIIPEAPTEVLGEPAENFTSDVAQPTDVYAINEDPQTNAATSANPDQQTGAVENSYAKATETITTPKKPSTTEKQPAAKIKEPEKLKVSAAVKETEKSKTTLKPPKLDNATIPSPPVLETKRWVIQVASFSDQANANALKDKLRKQGFPAALESSWTKDKGRIYRIKVGPELNKERADAMRSKLNQQNGLNSRVIAE